MTHLGNLAIAENGDFGATIIPFPSKNDFATNQFPVQRIIQDVLSHPDLENRIEEMIKSRIIELRVSDIQKSTESLTNPFDAIYLLNLEPDILFVEDRAIISRYATIEDLSDSISFNDNFEE